jgi:lipooligosaccharide transport system permease protein
VSNASIAVPNVRIAGRVWYRDARNFSKLWRGALLPTFLDPMFYLLAMGFGLGTYLATIQGIPYKDFVAPGLVASAAMWAAAFETTYNTYIKMSEARLYDALIATPVEVPDLVAGEVAWAATRSLIYSTAFLVVVVAFGLVDSWWALTMPLFALLGGACFGTIGMLFTALIPKIDLYSYFFTLFITPMFVVHAAVPPGERDARAGNWPRVRRRGRQRGVACGADTAPIRAACAADAQAVGCLEERCLGRIRLRQPSGEGCHDRVPRCLG